MNRLQSNAVAVDLVDPLREFFGRQRPLLPVAIGESKGDVVAQAVVLQQQLELRRMRRAIDDNSGCA